MPKYKDIGLYDVLSTFVNIGGFTVELVVARIDHKQISRDGK